LSLRMPRGQYRMTRTRRPSLAATGSYTRLVATPRGRGASAGGRRREPGIDDEHLTRDPACLVAGEVDRAPAHVPRRALGAERRGPAAALPGFGPEVLHHRRPPRAGRDPLHADTARSELHSHACDAADH